MVDKETAGRVKRAYDMMLDFYGTRLIDINDGTLCRAFNWEERLTHLNRCLEFWIGVPGLAKTFLQLTACYFVFIYQTTEFYYVPFLSFCLINECYTHPCHKSLSLFFLLTKCYKSGNWHCYIRCYAYLWLFYTFCFLKEALLFG